MAQITEEGTTSSSRIFCKILFQELSEIFGLRKLNERLQARPRASVLFPRTLAATRRGIADAALGAQETLWWRMLPTGFVPGGRPGRSGP